MADDIFQIRIDLHPGGNPTIRVAMRASDGRVYYSSDRPVFGKDVAGTVAVAMAKAQGTAEAAMERRHVIETAVLKPQVGTYTDKAEK